MEDDKEHTAGHGGHPCGCGGHSGKHATGPTALDILDERFARGEIDKAEYAEKKQLISERPANQTVAAHPRQSALAATGKSGSAKR